ncbi:MAG: methyltransferase domain-containing protein [Pseudomonadota bacterium]
MTKSVQVDSTPPAPGGVTGLVGKAHSKMIFARRVAVLIEAVGAHVPQGVSLLDVGTGDGQIAQAVGLRAGCTQVRGLDVMVRPETQIPVEVFDGATLPLEDKSVDVVSFVDVLHHTHDPFVLLAEAARVARQAVVIKDHLCQGLLDHVTLRAMDWVGNAPHGVVLPYNYAARETWLDWFEKAHLEVAAFETDLPLYPAPLSWVFGRKLHFITRLSPLV